MQTEVIVQSEAKLELSVNGKKMTSSSRGRGSRRVYLFDDFVVKFASENSDVQNRNEVNFYLDVLEKGDEKFFPKLLDFGWFDDQMFVVQERTFESEEGEVTAEIEEQFYTLEEKYGFTDQCCYEGGTPINCMVTDDGLKIYDMGIYKDCEWSFDSRW